MSTKHILSRGVATLLALTPFLARGAADTLSGASPAWGTAANWSLAAIPGSGDNAIITATGAVDVGGSTLGGLQEIQDLTFNSTAAVSLTNNSSSTDMVLALNGLRGAGVPLIATVGDFAYAITGPGTNAIPHPLGLQLRASGEISVAATTGTNALTISGSIGEFGARSISKTGAGTLILSGTGANSYSGPTTVTTGTLKAGKTAGVNAIPGDLVIASGGTFILSASDQIANTSSVTINGGTFGDVTLNTAGGPPSGGPIDTVANVTLNGGTFLSNRNVTGFTATNLFKVTGGQALVQRGGVINAGSVEISGGSVNLDGGSSTPGNESQLKVGAGGLTLTGGTINLNAGPSNFGTTSVGSIVSLAGNVTSTGASTFVHLNPATAGPKAVVDLNGATRTFNVEGTLDMGTSAAQISIIGGSLNKTGGGALNFNSVNTYTGTTTVSGGMLFANKTGTGNAIAGDLIIAAGGIFRLGASDQIADTAAVTINGGTFGDAATIAGPPQGGPIDTVASLTVNSGSFLSNRNLTGFTVTNLLKVTGGQALVQRGGVINAGSVEISGGSVNLDGGSSTPGNESQLKVGAGGLTLTGGTINLNAGPSTVAANSVGSIVALGGDVTSTGTSSFVRQNPTVSSAKVDLGGGTRTFTVAGTLTIGTAAAPITITNGILTKAGAGTLHLSGPQTYATLNADGGVTNLHSALGTGTSVLNANATVNIHASQTLAALNIADGVEVTFGDGLGLAGEPEKFGAPALVPEPGALGLLAVGALGLMGHRRRNVA